MSKYIGNSMRCTQSSMELVSSVIGFDIVELWSEDVQDKKLHCTYVHANESLLRQYPEIIVGHYPNHKKEHKLSPRLCSLARSSSSRYHWRVVEKILSNCDEIVSLPANESSLHPEFMAPVKTEMAYLLENDETGDISVFIVGFALDRIEYSPKKLKFISGISFAIYVAAFDLDEDEYEDPDASESTVEIAELDLKAFLPRPLSTPFSSAMNLAGISHNIAEVNLGMGVWSQSIAELNISSGSNDRRELKTKIEVNECFGTNLLSKNQVVGYKAKDVSEECNTFRTLTTPIPSSLSMPPTWDPVDAFSYPVAEIPVSCIVPDNLLMEHFSDLQHITDGSNANIFLARFNGEKVIIKMIKEEVQLDQVAVHEFDVEHGMLSRISHPNIIKLKGAGRIPRRFIVLEYLGGGSLSSILSQNQAKPGLAQKLFRRPSFTYGNLLSRAKDMAEALHFLNKGCHPGATIIHRGKYHNPFEFNVSLHTLHLIFFAFLRLKAG